MRIAIFSDVHGNLSALESVLDDIEREGADLVVFAGDLCLFGPRPAECVRLVQARRLPAVIGNTDGWTASASAAPDKHAAALAWTREQLTPGERAWLGRLPFAVRVSPTSHAAGDLLIVHANPRNVDDLIFPSESDQLARWGTVRQPDGEVQAMLAGTDAAVVAYGHLHIPGTRPAGDRLLVNVSSVSMPGDEDGRAKYARLSWGNGNWTADHRRIAYDVAAEAAAFRERRPPNWETAVAELESQGYYYPQRI